MKIIDSIIDHRSGVITSELTAAPLTDDYVAITATACMGWYAQGGPFADMFPPINAGEYRGRKVILVDPHEHESKQFLKWNYTGQEGTGSIDGDVLRIFERIQQHDGTPIGFIRKPHGIYEKDHPQAGKLVGRIYVEGRLQPEERSLADFFAQIIKL